MEDKLLELKEEFCKWYCLNKKDMDKYELFGFCDDEHCMVNEYIRFIRDELN